MYPFLFRGASTSFLALSILLTGCSISDAPPPKTVSIPSSSTLESSHCEKTGSSGGIALYRCESDVGPLFVTTVKDCSIPEKFTFQATTRQLLVGVVDLSVITQEPAAFDSRKALNSIIHGMMDVDPFIMSIFTFKEKECVTDLVLWKGSGRDKPSHDETERFSSAAATLAQQIVPTLIPAKESSRAGS